MNIQQIPVTSIKSENAFRKEPLDLELALDIKTNGLSNPLVVEKISDKHFILVEGYRRFYAASQLNLNKVPCVVETRTTEVDRVLKRLKNEFFQKRRTSYDIEKMIKYLLGKDFEERDIAKCCNVTVDSVKKYLKGKDVNTEWLKRGEKTGAGRHGYTVIHNTQHLKGENQQYLVEIYTDRDISGEHLKEIQSMSKLSPFEYIEEDLQRECIDQSISYIRKRRDDIKDIVYEISLKESSSNTVHLTVYKLVNKLLNRIISNFHHNFTNNLSIRQKNEIYEKLELLIERLKMPLKWSDFPDEHLRGVDKPGNEDNISH